MPKDSSTSVTAIFLDREAIARRLEQAVQHLVRERPEVRQVWLFGSFARGQSTPGSDIDLAVLVSGPEPRPWPERMSTYLPYFRDVGMPVDIFCYTLDEWESSRELPFFQQIAEGRRL